MRRDMQSPAVEIPGPDAQQQPYPPSIERALGPLKPQVPAPGFYSEVSTLCPIGAFDSGFGGLSVISEIRRLLPNEDIIFFGDNANCPYGGRSDEWLRARSLEITDFLLERGAKIIVVACNTASAAGLEHLRALRKVPVVGLVPAVKPAVERTRSRVVGVLATPATIRGRLLIDVVERFATPAGVEVVKVAPSGLVEAVERGDIWSDETLVAVRSAITPMLEAGADAIVLGSTHFPFLRPVIREIAGDEVALIDSGDGVARQTRRVLEAYGLLRQTPEPGTLTVYTSADPDKMRPLVWGMVGEEVEVLGVSSG
jgi:glutamate racemase